MHLLCLELLWTAPEILRDPQNNGPSKESDVYSAAIVMYEIMTRNEPFETERLDIGTEGKTSCFFTRPTSYYRATSLLKMIYRTGQ